MAELLFWVPGVPQPQGSTRAFKRGAKIVTTSDNVRLRPWRHAVTAEVQQRLGYMAGAAFTGPVELLCRFYFARPKGHINKHGQLLPSAPIAHVVKPDLSKLIRAVEDSLTDAGVWIDDSQVVRTASSKDYADHCPPGAHITVRTRLLDPDVVAPMALPADAAPVTPGVKATNGDQTARLPRALR